MSHSSLLPISLRCFILVLSATAAIQAIPYNGGLSSVKATALVDTTPSRSSRQASPVPGQAPSRAIMPGNRLDTNFNAFPVQNPAIGKAAPAWLRKKAGGSPTYVIDGKMATADQLRKLRQSEVASINVLEGAKAASLYGKNTRNGMVIITTKARSKSIPN